MALTTLALVQQVPGMSNQDSGWLTTLIGAASEAIKKYCKLGLELTQYTEYLDGSGLPELWLKQWPVVAPRTTLTAGSNGLALPQATLSVASTTNFPTAGTLTVRVSAAAGSTSGGATVTYTGLTSTSFTGCAGGTGTLVTGYGVAGICVYQNQQGHDAYPQATGEGFTDTDLWLPGMNYYPELDTGGQSSRRGLLKAVAGSGVWSSADWLGWWGTNFAPYGNKLAANRRPCWPVGNGNVKVVYLAGYSPIPDDLQFACASLVASMVRNQPTGGPLQSEGLGSYNYQMAQRMAQGALSDLTDYAVILRRYREVSF